MMKTAALKKEYAKVWLHKPLGQKANNDEWLIKKILEKRPLSGPGPAGKTGLTGQRGKTGLTGKTGPAGKSSSLQGHLHMHQTDSPGQEAEQIHYMRLQMQAAQQQYAANNQFQQQPPRW